MEIPTDSRHSTLPAPASIMPKWLSTAYPKLLEMTLMDFSSRELVLMRWEWLAVYYIFVDGVNLIIRNLITRG